jgi:phage gp16-like protein
MSQKMSKDVVNHENREKRKKKVNKVGILKRDETESVGKIGVYTKRRENPGKRISPTSLKTD